MDIKFQNSKNDIDFKYLVSNTKIRRLGYLKILLSMFTNNEEYTVSSFNKKFESFAIKFEPFLLHHKNTKGIIKETKNGVSALPYVELALNLGLIIKNAYMYQLGKRGKVYLVLQNELALKENNPFELTTFDTIFFLEILLKEDYWFLYNILEQTFLHLSIKYVNLKTTFKSILLNGINDLKCKYYDDESKFKILDIEKRITKWGTKDSYMEHILMPRLNWLYDMNFIDLKNDLRFNLTSKGVVLFNCLSAWSDNANHGIVSAENYINNFYLKKINDYFDFRKKMFNFDSDIEMLDVYLRKSFGLFKTLAPNRTTFSLSANYAKLILFFKHSVVIDENDIRSFLESDCNTKYIFKYQEQYKDGYIQKITK